MNRLTVIAVAVAVVVTITVTTLLSRSSASSLPVPHIPAATAGHNPASGNKNGGGGGSGGGANGGSGSGAFVPGAAPTLTGCSVTVSNGSPLQGQTAETVTVTSTPDVQVSVVAVYAHTRSRHGGVTNSAGVVSLGLPVAHAPVGVTVGVTATASLRGRHVTCTTSFTPVP